MKAAATNALMFAHATEATGRQCHPGPTTSGYGSTFRTSQLNGRLKLSDAERAMLGKISHRLGRQALAEVATVARPDTILAWDRKLVAGRFDGSKALATGGTQTPEAGCARPLASHITQPNHKTPSPIISSNRIVGFSRPTPSIGRPMLCVAVAGQPKNRPGELPCRRLTGPL
jgi:hypothetical protein